MTFVCRTESSSGQTPIAGAIGPWPRVVRRRRHAGGRRRLGICRRRGDAARPVERRRGGAPGAARRAGAPSCWSSACPAPSAASPPSAPRIRRRCGWSAPSAISTASSPKARPTRAAGSTTAAGACASRSARARRRPPRGDAYAFLTAEGPPLHQIPVGPVHAGIIEPGHFRFTANGETVVRLEERLGYVHKGIDGLMLGAPLERAAQARRPRLRRQHGRLCHRLRPRRRGGARYRAAAARRLAARADGGAGAPRQPFRRHRRHLQRRLLLAHPRPLRHPARARAARLPTPASATA